MRGVAAITSNDTQEKKMKEKYTKIHRKKRKDFVIFDTDFANDRYLASVSQLTNL